MPYGTIAAEIIQSGTAGQPPQFMDLNGVERGELCRAWVNFNGTGTVAIRASFNVSSITDNGVGYYTVNFTNAMADGNYAMLGTSVDILQDYRTVSGSSTTSVQIRMLTGAGSLVDQDWNSVGIFR